MYKGTSVSGERDLGGSRSLGRTAGVSLAGRLMSYATRPGGTFDVFAAARDGQVSVLKQALTEGEEVDVQDEAGLTALMWAARAGRLSTAKYLVSQGASLKRRDEATGFSPLHFAAYYCRSSVVRVLVLAGADTKATDNLGRIPGARFQPLSYLSYDAFHRRRLIKRFLAGDLNDGMDDKGKTMFPMNSPLEAYDEEHRPQCVRLGSRDNLTVNSNQSSAEEGYDGSSRASGSAAKHHPGRRSRSRAPPDPYPGTSHRRASAEMARKAYATMRTMHSRVDDNSSARRNSVSEAGGGGEGGGRGRSDVRYYLRRGSMQQVAAKTRKILAGATGGGGGGDSDNDDGSRRSRTLSSQKRGRSSSRSAATRGAGGGEKSVNFYLRRSSLQGLPIIENLLSGGGGANGGEGDAAAGVSGTRGASGANEGRKGDGVGGDDEGDPAARMARDMAAAVASFEAAAAAATAAEIPIPGVGSGDCAKKEEHNGLDSVEAGRGTHRSGSDGIVRDRPEVAGEGEGGKIRRVSAKLLDGIRHGAKDLAAQVQGGREPSSSRRPPRGSPRGDRSAVIESADVESGARTILTPQGEEPPVAQRGLEGESTRSKTSRQRQQLESAADPTSSREHLKNGVVAGLAATGKGGDRPGLALPPGGRDVNGAAAGTEGGNGGRNPVTAGGTLSSTKSTKDGKAPEAELDSLCVGDRDPVVQRDSGSAASVLGPPRAADGEFDIANGISALDARGESTDRPGRSGTAASDAGVARGAGIHSIVPADVESRPWENFAVENQREAEGPSNRVVEGVHVRGGDRAEIHLPRPSRQHSSSSTGLNVAASRDGAAAAAAGSETTPLDGSSSIDPRSREPTDAFSVRSAPTSAGEEKEGGGMDAGSDAGPILSGEESATKRHRSGKGEGRSGRRKSHSRRKHKRSHRHRDKDSDKEGAGKSRRRRSRDHGLHGSAGGPTITALAPLKRIPPPSSSLAQRGTHQQGDGQVAEAAGDDGGGGDGGG
eukprot:g5673.t1